MMKLKSGWSSGLVLFVALAIAPPAVGQSDWDGSWTGTYQTAENAGDVELTIERVEGEWQLMIMTTSAQYPVSDPGPASEISVEGATLTFTAYWGTLRVEWIGELTGDSISGRLVTDHFDGKWEVTRVPGSR